MDIRYSLLRTMEFRPTILDCENTRKKILEDSTISFDRQNINKVKTAAKKSINKEMIQFWSSHLKSLVVQGQFLTIANNLNSDFNYNSFVFDHPLIKGPKTADLKNRK